MADDGLLFPMDPDAQASRRGAKPKPKPAAPTRKKAAPRTYSVTQLTRLVKLTLSQHLPSRITVEGEISNLTRPASGHLYFDLKDANAVLPAVVWRSAAGRLKFAPEHGMAVVARGAIDLYEPHGRYQFIVDRLEPAGLGALELAFRQLSDKLRKEGLFDEVHKKPLPGYPRTIAIVTSGTGAAIEDISKTLHRRWPIARKILYPVAVQGDAAPGEIAHAMGELNRMATMLGGVDVMIVGRGGGSLEDLWAFNEEIVARAIFASSIPVISGVGHEIDTTIADMVADHRAATPTAAAELAAPMLSEVVEDVTLHQHRLQRCLTERLANARQGLAALAGRPVFARPLQMVHQRQQQIDELSARLNHLIIDRIRAAARQLEQHAATLRRIEPHTALAQRQGQLREQQQRLAAACRQYLLRRCHQLDNRALRLGSVKPTKAIEQQRSVVEDLGVRLTRAAGSSQVRRGEQLEHMQQRLVNLDPRAVLRRGYSITRRHDSGAIITAEKTPQGDDLIVTELADKQTFTSRVVPTDAAKEKG